MKNDKAIYGETYYSTGRYGYTAVDYTHKNTSGSDTLITGIKPNKLGNEFASKVTEVQSRTIEQLAVATLYNESANSEELYLYTVNDSCIYDSHRKYADQKAKALFNLYTTDFSSWELQELLGFYRLVQIVFTVGAESYSKQFPVGGNNEWYNMTPLDIACCTLKYIQNLKQNTKLINLSKTKNHVT